MDPLIMGAANGLIAAGWTVTPEPDYRPLPTLITDRYPDLPPLFIDFAMHFRTCERNDRRAWFLTACDYDDPPAGRAFAWDKLAAAMSKSTGGWNPKDITEAHEFWDRHLPIAQSNAGVPEYLAIDTATGEVVHGWLADNQRTLPIAPDFANFLRLLERVGHADPAQSLIYAGNLAMLIHARVTDERPPRNSGLPARLRRWLRF